MSEFSDYQLMKMFEMVEKRPVFNAASENDYAKIKLALEEGGDSNEEFIGNMTPIMLASSHGNLKMVKLLIQHGANIHARNENGHAPIGFALGEQNDGCLDVAKLLIDNGATVNYKNNYDRTPLDDALEKGDKNIINFINKYKNR